MRTIALGAFDGLHIAHAEVLRGSQAVLLFREHPQKLLTGQAPPQLLSEEERRGRLLDQGLELLEISFADISQLSPEAFFHNILLARFGAEGLRCGYHYRFGFAAAGTAQLLQGLCASAGIALSVVPMVQYQGEAVSSTRIRQALAEGRLADANAMLGRPFGYRFEVRPGERIGRLLGAPTLNQSFPEGFAIPRFGVYASQAYVGGLWRSAVTNIGQRPCFRCNALRSETHIMGFSGELYGQQIPIRLLRYLREEKKFSNLEELKHQITQDIAACAQEDP